MDTNQIEPINKTLDAAAPLPSTTMASETHWRVRLGWRIALTLLLLLTLCLLGLMSGPHPRAEAAELPKVQTQSSSDPLVLAFYYTWFDENTWTYDTLSDLPAQQYASRDRGTMGRHIDEAKRAGIDEIGRAHV